MIPERSAVSDLRVAPSPIKFGETVTVTVTVENAGGEQGTYNVKLKANGVTVSTRSVTLNPGKSTSATFNYTLHPRPLYLQLPLQHELIATLTTLTKRV